MPGGVSTLSRVQAGVPQGSIIRPLLFLVYINDIVDNIQGSINLFADDTSLSMVVGDPDQVGRVLPSDIDKINQWAKKWLVQFNPSKSQSLVSSRKRFKLIIQVCLCQVLKYRLLLAINIWDSFFLMMVLGIFMLVNLSTSTSYNLRRPNNLRTITCRTTLYKNSFLPSVINDWNCLSDEMKNSGTLSAFKYRLNIDKPSPSKLYFFGDRKTQIIHARLRNKCSRLNEHFYLKIIVH